MDEAEDKLFDHPNEALSILQTIDVDELSSDKLHARYGLLYTKACYRNYIDAESDSLMQSVVDYYELHGNGKDKFNANLILGCIQLELNKLQSSSSSFMKALSYIDEVDDHFYRGQLFSHLARNNSLLHSADEEYFARQACEEYRKGNYTTHLASAMVQMAEAKLHSHDFDSCLIWADSSINISVAYSDTTTLVDAMRMKINCALEQNQYDEVDSLYQLLFNNYRLKATSKDLSRLALLSAHKGETDKVNLYLNLSSITRSNYNDSAYYYANAYRVYKRLHDNEKLLLYQDSLLLYEDQYLKEAFRGTTLAAQRDYAEYQKRLLYSEKLRLKEILLLSLLVIIALIFVMYYFIKSQRDQLRLKEEKIKNLQYELSKNTDAIREGMTRVMNSQIYHKIKNLEPTNYKLSSEDWNDLSLCYRNEVPMFEKTLTDLHPLSEIEWRVCMLIKIGLSPTDIANLINKSPGGVSSIRSRLYQKFFSKKGSSTDLDDFINSI